VQDARTAWRDASPPVIAPRLDPTSREIAEVTVIAVYFELQKSQNTRPEKRQA
jgi:hypothetical protein